MAVASWAASTAYALGDTRRAATAQVTGLFFKQVEDPNLFGLQI